jgi:hypothetical protein
MISRIWTYVVLASTLALVSGCRGDVSEHPPIHLNPNMDRQKRFDPQEKNRFFLDERAMRRPVKGTVAVGQLRTDDHLHNGVVDGRFVQTLPPSMTLNLRMLKRGRKRFRIYCSTCHDLSGSGNGIMFKRDLGLPRPADFHQPRLRAMTVGELFKNMSDGKSNMPAMRRIIPAADRWAVVAYIRALQMSRNARISDVPKDLAVKKGWIKK